MMRSFGQMIVRLPFIIPKNGYHTTRALCGRKGASAFVEKPRDFSKKQKKRHKKKLLLREVDQKYNAHREEKAASDLISEQLEQPQTKHMIDTVGDSMLKDIREMMLPDGLQALLENFEESDNIDDSQLGSENSLNFAEIGMNLSSEYCHISGIVPSSQHHLVTSDQANHAVILAASQGKSSFVDFMLNQMKRLRIPLENRSLKEIILQFSKLGDHKKMEDLFDKALECDVIPDSPTWSVYIEAKARAEGHANAIEVMNRVRHLGIEVTCSAYNGILSDMVNHNKNDEAFEFWMLMKEEGVMPDVISYEIMMQQCVQTHQIERAFNYIDEMKGCKIEPTAAIFEKLFMCCGSAPHWVNGYQDIIFDAMALMEGSELVPTTGVYNSIINSFGRAGDASAAEYYFWEMRDKGIEQTSLTYKCLFGALARSQRVGASKYKVLPRYVRPPDKPKTELQRLMLKAGAISTANIISSRYSSDGKLDRGKRQYAPLVSTDDEISPEEAEQELLEELRRATMDKPDLYGLLQRKSAEQRALRDSETGRQISLSLLTRGQLPELGRIYHIPPRDSVVVEEEKSFSDQLCKPDLDIAEDESCAFSTKIQTSATSSDLTRPESMRAFNQNIVDLLDGESISSLRSQLSTDIWNSDVIPKEEVDKQWSLVIFGRCPDPDYTAPIKERRRDNIIRADSLYGVMLEQGIEPDCDILSAYMSVSSEAMQWEKAQDIIDMFKTRHDISPDVNSFRFLIRMHIFMSDIKGCIDRFEEMKNRGILPDRETYGLLVATLSHREDLINAVRILEEANDNGIQISNRHIKKLRARFNKLGLKHPNIFPDPLLWVKDVKNVRRNRKNAPPGNKLQYLSSQTFL